MGSQQATPRRRSAQTVDAEIDVEVIAHRGLPRKARENSLAGFELAIAAGADGIELDVHATRDLTFAKKDCAAPILFTGTYSLNSGDLPQRRIKRQRALESAFAKKALKLSVPFLERSWICCNTKNVPTTSFASMSNRW